MNNLMTRLLEAFTFRADFRMGHWLASKAQARQWQIASAVSNVIAQVLVAMPGTMLINSIGGILMAGLLYLLPARLSVGTGQVMVVQAIGSVVLIVACHLIRMPFILVESLAFIWAIYCGVVLLGLVLKYIQTPKTQMPE